VKAIELKHFGDHRQLVLTGLADPIREPGQLLVRVLAAGVNFIDIYQRSGTPSYQKHLPFIPGLEGAGEVLEHDEDSRLRQGDIVAWPFWPGSYAELVSIDQTKVVSVPEGIDPEVAAASMLQGLTAHYLVNDTYKVTNQTTAVVLAASGGAGLLLVQMIKKLGGKVIGVASTKAKVKIVKDHGADEALTYEEFGDRVATNSLGVDVVFDSVGNATYLQSLKSLKPRGLLALFGASNGPVPPFDLQLLNPHGSLFATRPNLANYIATQAELETRAAAVFDQVLSGDLEISIHKTYPLADAGRSHSDLESRATSGKLILIP
jgi:NADPH2:quinone reductase